ncbi:hypothetical protein F4802DRAFT_12091 [Xylaria palmicola]|nr:hypothetical protein F4802DRAFT_12091 [Xylaria palmicola]
MGRGPSQWPSGDHVDQFRSSVGAAVLSLSSLLLVLLSLSLLSFLFLSVYNQGLKGLNFPRVNLSIVLLFPALSQILLSISVTASSQKVQ